MEIKYKVKIIDTLSERILYNLFSCVSTIVAALYAAFVFSKIWQYIIVSVFHVEELSIAAAFGVLFFIHNLIGYKSPVNQVITEHFNKQTREISKWEFLTTMTFGSVAYNSFVLFIAFAISFFIK